MRGKRIDVDLGLLTNFLISVFWAVIFWNLTDLGIESAAVAFLVSFLVIGFFQIIMRGGENFE